jgi:hypothetical protein
VRLAFSAVAALRSTLTSRLVSELRFGLVGGTVIFNNGINASEFEQWRGYAPGLGFVTSPFRTTGQTRRNTPLKQGNANFTYSMSAHLLNFGFSFTQLNTWTTSVNGTQFIPTIAFGVATGDPIITGGTNIFTAANFPGASTADMQTNAPSLYALLTGAPPYQTAASSWTIRPRLTEPFPAGRETSSASSVSTSRIPA